MIRIQKVKFIEEADIPAMGEKGGLSNERVRGGNEAPVMHEMLYNPASGILTIHHLSMSLAHPDTHVPAGNIRYMREEPPPVEEVPAPVPPPVEASDRLADAAAKAKAAIEGAQAALLETQAKVESFAGKKGGRVSKVIVGDDDGTP